MIHFLNDAGHSVLPAGLAMLIQSSVLIGFLLILEWFLRRRIPAALRCGLWLLVVAKLLLPPSLKSPTGAGYWLGPWITAPIPAVAAAGSPEPPVGGAPARVEAATPWISTGVNPTPADSIAPTSVPRPHLSAAAGLLCLWGFGSVVLLIWMLRRNQQVQQLVVAARSAPMELQTALQTASAQLQLRQPPELRLSTSDHSPAVWGLLRPVIVLPAALAHSLDASALRDVLLHELIHIRRRDLWLNLPQALAQVIWWWNPLVWLANARIRFLREQAVDQEVMLIPREDSAPTYPETLVAVARYCSARSLLALNLVGILESRRDLRSRIERLLVSPLPRRAGLGVAGWATLMVVAMVGLPMASARRVEPAPLIEQRPTPAAELQWRPWSPEAVRDARARGQMVLVDFTAKWCVACQVNRSTVLEDPAVVGALQSAGVVTLVADWTRPDMAITRELKSLGRVGVPAVVLYPSHPSAGPILLPEDLGTRTVTDAVLVAQVQAAVPDSGVPHDRRILHLEIRDEPPVLTLEGQSLDPEDLENRFRSAVANQPETVLSIRDTSLTSSGRVTPVIQAAQNAGITRFTLGNFNPDYSPPDSTSSRIVGYTSFQFTNASPATTGRPTTTSSTFMISPELVQRYGIWTEATGESNASSTNAPPGMNPELARTHGLTGAGGSSLRQTNSPTVFVMDPALARRYGLIPRTPAPPAPAEAPPQSPADIIPSSIHQGSKPRPVDSPLMSRTLRFEPDPFVTALESRVAFGVDDFAPEKLPSNHGGDFGTAGQFLPTGPTERYSGVRVDALLRKYLSSAGTTFPPAPAGATEGTSAGLSVDPNQGLLSLTGTPFQIRAVEAALESLSKPPRIVQFRIRVFEVATVDGMALTLESVNVDLSDRPVGGLALNGVLQGPEASSLLGELKHNPSARVLTDTMQSSASGAAVRVTLNEIPSFGDAARIELTPTAIPGAPTLAVNAVAQLHPDSPVRGAVQSRIGAGQSLLLMIKDTRPNAATGLTGHPQTHVIILVTPQDD